MERQGKRGGSVGVAISCSCGHKFDQPLGRDDALDAGEIVAEFAIGRDTHLLTLERLLRSAVIELPKLGQSFR
jgi:hypothetical protein